MTVDILGTTYEIIIEKYNDNKNYEKYNISAYCDGSLKKIFVSYPSTRNDYWKGQSKEGIEAELKDDIRHEIIHAFLHESGLAEASFVYSGPWATNEEMVDWFALQGEKIFSVWCEIETLLYHEKITKRYSSIDSTKN